jgi:hypothetical protein
MRPVGCRASGPVGMSRGGARADLETCVCLWNVSIGQSLGINMAFSLCISETYAIAILQSMRRRRDSVCSSLDLLVVCAQANAVALLETALDDHVWQREGMARGSGFTRLFHPNDRACLGLPVTLDDIKRSSLSAPKGHTGGYTAKIVGQACRSVFRFQYDGQPVILAYYRSMGVFLARSSFSNSSSVSL